MTKLTDDRGGINRIEAILVESSSKKCYQQNTTEKKVYILANEIGIMNLSTIVIRNNPSTIESKSLGATN